MHPEPHQILVVGATGATGQRLVAALLERGHHVRAIVRSADRLPAALRDQPNLQLTIGTVLDLQPAQLAEQVRGCTAIASCLGHRMSLRGMLGPPYRLVTDTVRRLCEAVQAESPAQPVKVVLMNTAGNRHRGLAEPLSPAERGVLCLLRLLVQPHADNEQAAEYLRTAIGPDHPHLQWVAVRPDGLVDENAVTPWDLHASPIRSAIFNAGRTSRINVGTFMADLIDDDALWADWQGQMPVIYNAEAN